MDNREEYVARIKSQLDHWSVQLTAWESAARGARKTEWQKQVGILRSRIDDMAFRMELLKGASTEAWQEVARGADEAREAMQESFERARSKFDRV